MKGLRAVIVAAGLGLALASARAAYLESDGGPRAEPPELVPPRPVPPLPPRPGPGLGLRELVQRVQVGAPHSYRRLTVYPLLLRGGGRRDALTLDEALSCGDLVVREREQGEVARVMVSNESRRPVFLMAGEILLGGRQNRIVRDDVLLPPHSGFVAIPVYCGEQDRWQGPEPVFKSAGALAAPSVRRMAGAAESQDRIWREIDGQLAQAEVRAPTRSYQQLYDDARLKGELDRCVAEFRPCCPPETVGCVILDGWRILGVELFSDASLFDRLWPRIIRSYGAPVVCREVPADLPRWDERREWGGDRIRGFLNSLLDAGFAPRYTPGLGELFDIRGPAHGTGLEEGGGLVHAAAFPEVYDLRPLREDRR